MIGKRDNGFTIVELVVTIVILVILTTIVTVRLIQTETSGENREMEIDTATIATGLEVYYENGSPDRSIPKGYYPGMDEFNSAKATSPPFSTFLEGVSASSYVAPGSTITDSFYFHLASGSNPDGSFTDAQVLSILNGTNHKYLYHPVRRNNISCITYTICVKYFLYYIEKGTDGAADKVITIRSKNQ